jgi:hypothetical protein
MSQISITGASTGTATFTIESPATSTNRTITLADATGTMVVSGTTPSLNGITFPATQVASAGANTLDDYEEGTWTPADASGAGLTFTVTFATYTKIGRQVICNAKIIYPSTANGNSAEISGLPFTSNSNNHAVSTMSTDQGAYFSLVVTQSTTSLITRNLSLADLTNANLSGKTLIFTISYPV